MNITVQLRDNKTKEIVNIDDSGEESLLKFIWSEGNNGCDCNRYLYFQRAKGLCDDGHDYCSDDEYSVKITDKISGSVIYDEFDD